LYSLSRWKSPLKLEIIRGARNMDRPREIAVL
jgi:hypothetical protein